jgi:ArsR family transcriptional regulator
MKTSTNTLLLQFKAMSDPLRVRLVALCALAECSVSELTQLTGHSQPRISQHLKQLCGAGLLERFRDGHFVFYRVSDSGDDASIKRRLLSLLPGDEPQFASDRTGLRRLRAGDADDTSSPATPADRALHRALVELTVVRPLGDLLDIGCGQGRILKLLASRAQRAVGVDIDSNARCFARAELLLAGTPNTSLRQGNMVALPFDDGEFDTIILDDVLTGATDPTAALHEAMRLLSARGRIILLASIGNSEHCSETTLRERFREWANAANFRLASPRSIPSKQPSWLLAVAMAAEVVHAAA